MVCEASPARMRFSLSDLGGIACWVGSGLLKRQTGENSFVYQTGPWDVFGLTGAMAGGVMFFSGEDTGDGGAPVIRI